MTGCMGGLIQWVSDYILGREGWGRGGRGERERESKIWGEKEGNERKVGEDKKWGES